MKCAASSTRNHDCHGPERAIRVVPTFVTVLVPLSRLLLPTPFRPAHVPPRTQCQQGVSSTELRVCRHQKAAAQRGSTVNASSCAPVRHVFTLGSFVRLQICCERFLSTATSTGDSPVSYSTRCLLHASRKSETRLVPSLNSSRSCHSICGRDGSPPAGGSGVHAGHLRDSISTCVMGPGCHRKAGRLPNDRRACGRVPVRVRLHV